MEPIVIKSLKAAAPYFEKEALEALKGAVDFDRQVLLVFAWRGSGRDRLAYDIAESMPEQVTFHFTRGKTRDLRSHVKVFALRSNVKWRVADDARKRDRADDEADG